MENNSFHIRSCFQNRFAADVELSPVPVLDIVLTRQLHDGSIAVRGPYEIIDSDFKDLFDPLFLEELEDRLIGIQKIRLPSTA